MGIYKSKIKIELVVNDDLQDISFMQPGSNYYNWNLFKNMALKNYTISSAGFGYKNIITLANPYIIFCLDHMKEGFFRIENEKMFYYKDYDTKFDLMDAYIKIIINDHERIVTCIKSAGLGGANYIMHVSV